MQAFGISTDSVAAQAAFAKAQKLNFQLLSDPDGSAARKYGVFRAGRRGSMAQRKSFVIDPNGTLRHITDRVSVATHGADMAALIEKLRGE